MPDIFKKNSVEMLVLYLLSKEDSHGYDLVQKIKEKSKGLLSVQLTSLYPVLYRLSDDGYITGVEMRADPPANAKSNRRSSRVRVVYHLEDSGKARLEELQKEHDEYINGYMNILSSHNTG